MGLIAVLDLAACGQVQPSDPAFVAVPIVRFFDPVAEHVAQDADAELSRERSPIDLEGEAGRATVTTCRDFLALRATGAAPATTRDGETTAQYAMCAVAALAPHARRPERSFFDAQQIGEDLDQFLDLRSFVSSLSAEADGGRTTFAAIPFAHARPSATALEVTTPAWRYDFQALAAADFDGDGIEDLLVGVTDAAREGSAIQTSTFLLRRTAPGGPILAELPGLPDRAK